MEHHENPTHTAFTYDDRGRLSTACRRTADGTLLVCITYVYDDAGGYVTHCTGEGKLFGWAQGETGQLPSE